MTSNLSVTGGTLRWMSPELLDPSRFGLENSRPTKESDCYALGMVILEVLSGQPPFEGDWNYMSVVKVVEGKHPERPQGAKGVWLTDELWGVLEQCWSLQPTDRPTAEAICGHLEHHSLRYTSIARDLVKLGVKSRFIPFIFTTAWNEQLPEEWPPFSPTEVENLVETLDKVHGLLSSVLVVSAKTPHDQVVSSPTVNPSLKNRCFRVLRKVSHSHAILPKSYYPEGVTLSDTIPYASGGFADIWKCQRDGKQVCVKAFRTQTTENLDKIKRVCGAISTRVSSG